MPILDLLQVSARLKGFRARLAATQAEVAEGIPIGLRTYQSWEAGDAQTTPDNYERVALFYSKRLKEPITGYEIMHGRPEPGRTDLTIEKVREDLNTATDTMREFMQQELASEIRDEVARQIETLLLTEDQRLAGLIETREGART